MVQTFLQMETFTLGSIFMENQKVLDNINGQMVQHTKVNF